MFSKVSPIPSALAVAAAMLLFAAPAGAKTYQGPANQTVTIPASGRSSLPAFSPEAKIEARHRALGRLDVPVSGVPAPAGTSSEASVASSDGFDWGDAGVGAAAALLLVALAGGGLALRRQRGVAASVTARTSVPGTP